MRIRRGSAVVFALAAAAAIAVAAIAVAAPNGNSSSLSRQPPSKFSPNTLPKDNFKSGGVFVHTHTNYANPGNPALGGSTRRAQLFFDDDGKVNSSSVPNCERSQLEGDITMKVAMDRCGNARFGTGKATAFGGGFTIRACVLVFDGKPVNGHPRVFVFTRANATPPGNINCDNPRNNTNGNATVLLTGVGKANPSSLGGDFTHPDNCTVANGARGCQIDFDNIDNASPFPLTDFQVNNKKDNLIQARCHDADHRLNIKGKFTYTDGQSDLVGANQTCTVG